jgi:hypothetical protein
MVNKGNHPQMALIQVRNTMIYPDIYIYVIYIYTMILPTNTILVSMSKNGLPYYSKDFPNYVNTLNTPSYYILLHPIVSQCPTKSTEKHPP